MLLKEKEEAADEVDSFLLDLSLKEKRGRGEEGIGEADEGHSEKIPESRWLSSPPSLKRSQVRQMTNGNSLLRILACVITNGKFYHVSAGSVILCHILAYRVILSDCVFNTVCSAVNQTHPPFICFQALLTFLNLRQKYLNLMTPLELKGVVSLSQFDFSAAYNRKSHL